MLFDPRYVFFATMYVLFSTYIFILVGNLNCYRYIVENKAAKLYLLSHMCCLPLTISGKKKVNVYRYILYILFSKTDLVIFWGTSQVFMYPGSLVLFYPKSQAHVWKQISAYPICFCI